MSLSRDKPLRCLRDDDNHNAVLWARWQPPRDDVKTSDCRDINCHSLTPNKCYLQTRGSNRIACYGDEPLKRAYTCTVSEYWIPIRLTPAFVPYALLLLLLLLLLLSQSFHRFFLVLFLLNQWWTPPLRLQVSDCITFLIMCDVPSTAVFSVENLLNAFLVIFPVFF
jgi:hypothetical protein